MHACMCAAATRRHQSSEEHRSSHPGPTFFFFFFRLAFFFFWSCKAVDRHPVSKHMCEGFLQSTRFMFDFNSPKGVKSLYVINLFTALPDVEGKIVFINQHDTLNLCVPSNPALPCPPALLYNVGALFRSLSLSQMGSIQVMAPTTENVCPGSRSYTVCCIYEQYMHPV